MRGSADMALVGFSNRIKSGFHKSSAVVRPNRWTMFSMIDGKKYARHGVPGNVGLLTFVDRKTAEWFYKTIGKGLPHFRPVKVLAEQFDKIKRKHGNRICLRLSKGEQMIFAAERTAA